MQKPQILEFDTKIIGGHSVDAVEAQGEISGPPPIAEALCGCDGGVSFPLLVAEKALGCDDREEWPLEEVEERFDGIDDPLLEPDEARKYRAVAARLNYLAPDRPDIGYSVNEAAQCMSARRVSHWRLVNKLGRYLGKTAADHAV